MGQRYLIGSNVLIDYTANRLPRAGSEFAERIFDTAFQLSVVSKIEVLGFGEVPPKLLFLEEFIATATIYALDDAVTQQTILLRRKYRKLKLGHAIIAATALTHNFTLITHNTADFKSIEGLTLLDLWEI